MKINIKKAIKPSFWTEILCGILVWLSFWQYVGSSNPIFLHVVKIGISVYLWIYLFMAMNIRNKEFMIIVSTSLYIILSSLTGRGSYQVVLTYLPIAVYFLKKIKLDKTIWTIIPISIVVYTLYAWFNSPNKFILFFSMSRNYVSVFLIFSLAIFSLYLEKDKRECPLVLVIGVWLGSISALGRGGIISSSVMLLLFFSKWFFAKRERKNFVVLLRWSLIGLAIIIASLWIYKNLEYVELTYFGRFFGVEASAEASSLYRLSVYKSYLKACFDSFIMLMFGTNASDFTDVVSNLHNSYLQIHSSFGLVGLLFILIGVTKTSYYLIKRKKLDLLFIMCGVLIRAGTDWCSPGFPMDIIILYYILLPHFNMTIASPMLDDSVYSKNSNSSYIN